MGQITAQAPGGSHTSAACLGSAGQRRVQTGSCRMHSCCRFSLLTHWGEQTAGSPQDLHMPWQQDASAASLAQPAHGLGTGQAIEPSRPRLPARTRGAGAACASCHPPRGTSTPEAATPSAPAGQGAGFQERRGLVLEKKGVNAEEHSFFQIHRAGFQLGLVSAAVHASGRKCQRRKFALASEPFRCALGHSRESCCPRVGPSRAACSVFWAL